MLAASHATLTVHVLLFASYADILGVESVDVTMPAPATVGAVVAHLRALPGGNQLPPKPLCARNLAHAGVDDAVADGDELAVLPPLAGG
ncbi:MAG TPA: MoaD/ThiS family protein [Gemmatimonadales bacterium]|nr:MoaD/ThiS family protein [Gemmatimonadales bacterium]